MGELLDADFGHPGDPGAAAEVTIAFKAYAEYHLERPLKSLRFVVPA